MLKCQRASPPEPPLKVRFFSEPPKYCFPSLTPSYLLKVTKFLGKISQLFLSLNNSDFNLIFM